MPLSEVKGVAKELPITFALPNLNEYLNALVIEN
jgi:hypothetical protein